VAEMPRMGGCVLGAWGEATRGGGRTVISEFGFRLIESQTIANILPLLSGHLADGPAGKTK
ncbi:unnamed protein product, partial [marine sediment metagenome]